MENETGGIGHAEIKIGDSMLMIAEASDEWQATQTFLYFYVKDVDAVYQKALAAGAETVKPPADQFYGDRNCS